MRPSHYTAEHDVNPLCGHHLKDKCADCGVCVVCDGCYCAEIAEDYARDVDYRRQQEWHAEHDKADHPDCPTCTREREESEGYTRCGKCGLVYPDGRPDHGKHNPPYCRPLYPQPTGIDWGYLLGQHVEFVGSTYSVHGIVYPDQKVPARGEYRPHLRIYRTDPGYEGEIGPVMPREWLAVHALGPMAVPGADEHCIGCHPEDEQGPPKPEGYQPQNPEACWHCGTSTTRGCDCDDCWENASYVPPSAAYHCDTCGRWWAYMDLNVTTITIGRPADA